MLTLAGRCCFDFPVGICFQHSFVLVCPAHCCSWSCRRPPPMDHALKGMRARKPGCKQDVWIRRLRLHHPWYVVLLHYPYHTSLWLYCNSRHGMVAVCLLLCFSKGFVALFSLCDSAYQHSKHAALQQCWDSTVLVVCRCCSAPVCTVITLMTMHQVD